MAFYINSLQQMFMIFLTLFMKLLKGSTTSACHVACAQSVSFSCNKHASIASTLSTSLYCHRFHHHPCCDHDPDPVTFSCTKKASTLSTFMNFILIFITLFLVAILTLIVILIQWPFHAASMQASHVPLSRATSYSHPCKLVFHVDILIPHSYSDLFPQQL